MGQNDRTISKIVLGGGLMGCLGGYSLGLLDLRHRLPAQHRRPSAPQLAGVHRADVRDDDSARGDFGGGRHARAERTADAVSPGVQREALPRARVERRVVPGDRSDGRQVRSRRARGSSSRASGHRRSMRSRPDMTTSGRLMLAFALAASLGAGTACRQDMHDAPRYDALEKSDFFADRRTSASADRRHGRARPPARGRRVLHGQGQRRSRSPRCRRA